MVIVRNFAFVSLFVLLSRETDRGATHMTNPYDPTRLEVIIYSD